METKTLAGMENYDQLFVQMIPLVDASHGGSGRVHVGGGRYR